MPAPEDTPEDPLRGLEFDLPDDLIQFASGLNPNGSPTEPAAGPSEVDNRYITPQEAPADKDAIERERVIKIFRDSMHESRPEIEEILQSQGIDIPPEVLDNVLFRSWAEGHNYGHKLGIGEGFHKGAAYGRDDYRRTHTGIFGRLRKAP